MSTEWTPTDDDSDLPMRPEYDHIRAARARIRREQGYAQPPALPHNYDPDNLSQAELERRAFDRNEVDAERAAFDPNYRRGRW